MADWDPSFLASLDWKLAGWPLSNTPNLISFTVVVLRHAFISRLVAVPIGRHCSIVHVVTCSHTDTLALLCVGGADSCDLAAFAQHAQQNARSYTEHRKGVLFTLPNSTWEAADKTSLGEIAAELDVEIRPEADQDDPDESDDDEMDTTE